MTSHRSHHSLDHDGKEPSPMPQPSDPDSFIVKGQVMRVDGTPLLDRLVHAVDVDIRSEQSLGHTYTLKPNGAYSITYTSEKFKHAERLSADLKIYVYNNPDAQTPLATSTVMWNAPRVATIDVIVGGDAVRGPPEFDLLRGKILPVLDGLAPADLVEDETHQDVTFLVGETGEESEHILFFIWAHQAQNKTKIDPDIFYGLYREGIPTDLSALLAQNPVHLRAALKAAMDANIISTRTDDKIIAILDAFVQAGLQHAVQPPGQTDRTPTGAVLSTTLADPQVFIQEMAKSRGGALEDFWKGLQDKPVFKGKVEGLQLTVQLGVLTLSHTPLVQELQQQQKAGTIKDFSDLARLSHTDWVNIFNKPGIGVPALVPGADNVEKSQNYATAITRILEDSFPAKFVTSRLADPQEPLLPGKEPVLSFLNKNTDFDFTTMRLPQYLAKKPDALNGIHNPDIVTTTVPAIQRIFAVAPQYSQARALITDGIHSSMQISRMGQSAFVVRYSSALGGQSEALKIFERAEQAHAMSFHLLANYGRINSRIRIPVLSEPVISSTTVRGAIPDLSTLFGSLDMCSCQDCRSVDGPAAYLVDILHFLKDRRLIDTITRDTNGNITKVTFKQRTVPGTDLRVEANVKDVLFNRRPDIGDVELNCQNTNTPVPYIDLTIEVMENAVSPFTPFKPFDLPTNATADLDAHRLQNLKSSFTPPLSDFAVITVMRKGEWWTIDELAFTYTIRKVGSNVQVQLRSLQTKGTAAERAANPQYMNTAAYEVLQTQVYPWSLPFDLWTETVRVYLAHIDVKRYDVMEAFSAATREVTLAKTDIAFERLNLTTFEAGIISTATTGQHGSPTRGIWNLWGFSKETLDAQNGIPDPADKNKMITGGLWSSVLTMRVDIFLCQSRLSFDELLNLIEFSGIFGGENLSIKPQEGVSADTCDLTKLQVIGANASVLHRICRFMRLLRKLDDWTILDLGQTCSVFNMGTDQASSEALLVTISHIERLRVTLSLPIESILTFWSSLSTTAYKDHTNDDEEGEPASMFARVFRNRTVTIQDDPIFTGDPSTISGMLSHHTAAITAALNVDANDLNALLADTNIVTDDVLSLDNLSKLYRHATLAQALGVSIRDYLALLKFQSSSIFASTMNTVIFVERANNALNSGFTLVELSYLLRHDFTEDSGVNPSDDVVVLLLGDIRTGLQQIAADYTYDVDTSDDNGDITKKKLALLNWDTTVIAQAVAMLNDTVSFSAPLATPLPADFAFPSELKDKITYDATASRLSYSRVMTVTDRDLLLNIADAHQDFKDAVTVLFTAPRTFFNRNMRSFSIPRFQAPLDVLPTNIKIPPALKKKVFFDVTSKTMNVVGALTDTERQTLVANADPTADIKYIAAINQLYNGPDNLTPTTDDIFLQASDISAMFDTADNANGPIVPRTRFALVLQKLLPKLKDTLSSQLVTQRISQFLGSESQIVEPLLTRWVLLMSRPAGSLFRTDEFVGSSASTPITRTAFPDLFLVLTLLWKIGLLVIKFGLTKKQLSWLFDFRTRPGDPSAGWLDLNALPLQLVTSGAASNFAGWERLVALFRLRDSLPLGENILHTLFIRARTTGEDLLTYLCTWAKWSLTDVQYLAGPQVFNFPFPASFQDEVALTRLLHVLILLKKIGCSSADGALYAKADQDQQQARAIVQTVKSKYDQTLWMTVARPLRNILRDQQRASLVAYLLAHVPAWRNPNDLYAYYLMDVEMGPCQLTSRIKQAISVTQLFVQRCLMNLEPEVLASSEVDVRWTEWKTLKSFRLTSAARQIFEKPENFLDSSLRDDKTPFFKDLESELQQNDLTKDVAENALFNYVEKLDTIAQLEVVSYYHQKEVDATGHLAIDILHVFARTRGNPQIYYYRTRLDSSEWTAWQRVDVDISGNHLIPVIWRRRLYLFWALFAEKQEKNPLKMPPPNGIVPAGDTWWEIKLAWTELKNGKWLAKTESDDFILWWKSGRGGIFDEKSMEKLGGRSLITFKATMGGDSDALRIYCLQTYLRPNIVGYFLFRGVKGNPTAVDFRLLQNVVREFKAGGPILHYVMSPTHTKIRNMSFVELDDDAYNGLYVQAKDFRNLPNQDQPALMRERSEALILRNTPDTFNIVYPHQDHQFSSQRPFFFQHGNRSFFVEPSDVTYYLPLKTIFPYQSRINPVWLDGSVFARYVNKPPIPTVKFPFPPGQVAGPIAFPPSFDLGNDFQPLPSQNPSLLLKSLPSSSMAGQVTSGGAALTAAVHAGGSTTLSSSPVVGITLDTSLLQWPINLPWPTTRQYKFTLFYHPFIPEFIKYLNRDGVDGLMQRPLQLSKNVNFALDYNPDPRYVLPSQYPDEDVDFDGGGMSLYNWELFFHVPLMIAERLSKNQHFAEAQKWFHYIFDPTDTSQLSSPQRFWRMKKFFETQDPTYSDEAIQNLFRFLATRGDPAALANLSPDNQKRLAALEENVRRWRNDPFNPYLVARTRSTAFQKAVVMKYLDNLIAWGDQLFRQDTIEAINQATQLFILAADILGERPAEISPRTTPLVQTYNSIEPMLDDFSNALVQIEELVPAQPANLLRVLAPIYRPYLATPAMLYFCVPKNDKLLGYWDMVADRLFKIRNCMNLQGVVRQLALFEPPIDPALLVKAAASGVDLGSILNDINAPLPHYRFAFVVNKATEICNELKGLGAAFLAALEKKDAESLSLLRSTHEMKTLAATRKVKQANIDEATETWKALTSGKDVVQARYDFYSNVAFMNPWEILHMSMEGSALLLSIIEAATQPVAAVASLIPDVKLGAPTSIGATWGGQNLHYSASYFGAFLSRSAGILNKGSSMVATMASYQRRKNDWDLQALVAQRELAQYDHQIAGALVRKQIAEKDLVNHDLQIQNAKEVDDFLRNKFTNQDLYDWMIGQLSTLYFQSYQAAYDAAKKAERAYAYELGLVKADIIQFGYWDSLKKGLYSGEKLAHDLKRMETSYIDQDRREYEIVRNVSLVQLDPVALIQLKETGECFFGIPEALFDLDFPGHYFRRLKSVSLTIPCVVGPYISLSSTLTLLKSSIRTSSIPSNTYARRDNDARFTDFYAQAQSIVTSSAQNDTGLFDSTLQQDRYLPFERAGAISSWRLQLPPPGMTPFDVSPITDVILHIRYTARDAGEPLRSLATSELRQKTLDSIALAEGATGLARFFSVRHEFPNVWSQLLRPAAAQPAPQKIPLPLTIERFPFVFQAAKSLTFTRVEFFVRIRSAYQKVITPDVLQLSFADQSTANDPSNKPLGLTKWNGVLRAAKQVGKGVGNYVLRLESGEKLPEDSVEEVMLVVHYQAKWA